MQHLKVTEEDIQAIIENPSPIHALLLSEDFATFIAYVHLAINGSNFQFQPFHFIAIKKLQAIVEGKNKKRNLALCMPVGSGKTLLVQYFIAWTFCRSMNNAYIYSSHSEKNIMKLSREVKDMFAHKLLQSLFKLELKADEGSKTNWSFKGAINRTGLLATTMGTGSTGADAGNPNLLDYSGALIIDDPIDAGKIRRPLALEEVINFYDEKLTTRRRTQKTPTILVMQRLVQEDLAGWLKDEEKNDEYHDWDFIEIPALDENEQSFWESRYPAESLMAMRKKNPFKFYAQYQQNPIKEDGTAIFDKSKFAWYKELPQMDEITASWDLAVKVKEINDYSVCEIWGSKRNKVGITDHYLIYVWRNRVLYPKLKAKFIEIDRLYNPNRSLIEDKSAGETLIPDLKADGYTNIVAINPGTQDKVERAAIPSEIIDQGRVFLPHDAPWLDVFLDEVLTFPKSDHDDQCFIAGTLISTRKGDIKIENIKIGDEVITPFGFFPVINCQITENQEVIEVKDLKLIGTKNHPIFTFDKDFLKMDSLTQFNQFSKLKICDIMKTTLLKLLNSMELNINEWEEKEGITCLNPNLIKEGGVLKAYMLQFTSIIHQKEFKKAIIFITRTATHLITALKTWSVYKQQNIIKYLKTLILINRKNTLIKFALWLSLGIKVKKEGKNIQNWRKAKKYLNMIKNVNYVKKSLKQNIKQQNIVVANVAQNTDGKTKSSIVGKHKVYNLKIDKIPLYYANGVLVHNCDAMTQYLNWSQKPRRGTMGFNT